MRAVLRGLALAVLVAVLVFPVYWMVASSLNGGSQFSWPPELFPSSPTLDNFVTVLTDQPVVRWFLNTFLVALGTTVLALALGTTAGIALSRMRGRTAAVAGVGILTAQMLPATLIVIPVYLIFAELGLVDSTAGLVLANTAFTLPVAVWMLKGFFDGIPREVEEAAMVDGCGRLRAYWLVLVPLARPGMAAVGIFCFILTWDEFFLANTLINDEGKWVLSVGISSFEGEYQLRWGEMLAASTLFAVPPIIFFLVMQRRLISGMTAGAVKG